MENLSFTQVQKGNRNHARIFRRVFMEYLRLEKRHGVALPKKRNVKKWMNSILDMQGPHDRHLELCYDGGRLVGFLYGKVDHAEHNGFVKPGFGYIMEFYVRRKYWRRGYGRAMFARLESLFAADGAARMYLNADPVTGEPFWLAMGFLPTAEVSPENGMVIFERDVLAAGQKL